MSLSLPEIHVTEKGLDAVRRRGRTVFESTESFLGADFSEARPLKSSSGSRIPDVLLL
jgi:hypothetical protein